MLVRECKRETFVTSFLFFIVFLFAFGDAVMRRKPIQLTNELTGVGELRNKSNKQTKTKRRNVFLKCATQVKNENEEQRIARVSGVPFVHWFASLCQTTMYLLLPNRIMLFHRYSLFAPLCSLVSRFYCRLMWLGLACLI